MPRRAPDGPSEPRPVAVAVAVGAGVGVAFGDLLGDLAEDDHAGGAAVDAQGAAGADVFVDDEGDVVGGILAGLFGVGGVGDGVDGDHVDAFPGADVDAAFAEDAIGLVDVEELLGLDRRGEERRVDFLELVVGDEVRHRRIPVGLWHPGKFTSLRWDYFPPSSFPRRRASLRSPWGPTVVIQPAAASRGP